MELDTVLSNRRSVRIYSDKRVEDSAIRQIIEAGTWAPSACNIQGWRFIVIDKKEIFSEILKHGAAAFLKSTNQAILVLYNNNTDNLMYSDYIQSASACIENMLLKAYSLGIGACWINNLPEKKVLRKLFNIPSHYDPIALVSIGYPVQQPNPRPRKHPLDEIIAYNMFSFNRTEGKGGVKLRVKRFARKIYYKLPLKSKLLKFVGKFEKKFDN